MTERRPRASSPRGRPSPLTARLTNGLVRVDVVGAPGWYLSPRGEARWPTQLVGNGDAQLLADRGKSGLIGFRRILRQVARDGIAAELAGRRRPGDQRVCLAFPWPELSQIVLDVVFPVIRVLRISQVVRRLLLRRPEIVDRRLVPVPR